MRKKHVASFFMLYIFPILLTLGNLGIGFSSWLVLENAKQSINKDVDIDVGNVEIGNPCLSISSISSPEYHYEDGHVYLRSSTYGLNVFKVDDTCDFFVNYKFRVANNYYSYMHKNVKYIKIKTELTITNVNQDLSNVFGLPHESGNDLCIKLVITDDPSNWGWWQANSLTKSFKSNTQTINCNDYRLIKNFTPDAEFTDFELEYTFKHDMYKILFNNQNMKFNLKAKLSVN